MPTRNRLRSGAIIINGSRVALIRRKNSERGKLYFIYPGGGVESGEQFEEAVVREVREETGLEVSVERLVAVVWRHGNQQNHYFARIIGGTFGAGDGPEMQGMYPSSRGTYEATWTEINELLHNPVYPRRVSKIVVKALHEGWPDDPRECVDDDE